MQFQGRIPEIPWPVRGLHRVQRRGGTMNSQRIRGTRSRPTRRDFLALGLGLPAAVSAACRAQPGKENLVMAGKTGLGSREQAAEGRLLARPGRPRETGPAGLHPLGLERRRDAFLYVPASYRADRPAPLVVMLHGAGGSGLPHLRHVQPLADETGLLLLAPDSRLQSWDIIVQRDFGPDVAFLDRALAWTFERYAVDPARLAAEGFSDGASYALSLGVTNGDLFSHVIAFSPGFMVSGDPRGKPRIYVSHGTRDTVLPIDSCSRRLVPRLKGAGYDVRYHEFDGPHTVPEGIAREALDWFTGAA
jgi:phospholipase/carboxylesterase